VVGGLLWLLPEEPRPAPPPAPGPKAQALTAVTAGVPAALPDLAALIGDREARVRVHPRDARSWAVLGSAYVEQGRRTGDALYYPKAEEALRTSLKVRAKGNDASAEAMDGLAALANERHDFRAARTWGEAAVKAGAEAVDDVSAADRRVHRPRRLQGDRAHPRQAAGAAHRPRRDGAGRRRLPRPGLARGRRRPARRRGGEGHRPGRAGGLAAAGR
jgi:hypothetical protein